MKRPLRYNASQILGPISSSDEVTWLGSAGGTDGHGILYAAAALLVGTQIRRLDLITDTFL